MSSFIGPTKSISPSWHSHNTNKSAVNVENLYLVIYKSRFLILSSDPRNEEKIKDDQEGDSVIEKWSLEWSGHLGDRLHENWHVLHRCLFQIQLNTVFFLHLRLTSKSIHTSTRIKSKPFSSFFYFISSISSSSTNCKKWSVGSILIVIHFACLQPKSIGPTSGVSWLLVHVLCTKWEHFPSLFFFF